MKSFLLVAVLAVLPMQAQAQNQMFDVFYSGSKLVTQMREYEKLLANQPGYDRFDAGVYRGYVAGAHDGYSITRAICTPISVTAEQVEAIVAAYLKANPKRWNEAAIGLVGDALVDAFPCG